MQQHQKQQTNNNNFQNQFLFDFFSGGTAGIISKTASAPIERVKLILQTQNNNKSVTKKYNGIYECFKRTIQQEGILSMWRGNGANVLRYFPTQALNFSFKEKIGQQMQLEKSKLYDTKYKYVLKSVLAGGIAGSMTICFVYPLDFARTRLAVDMGSQKRQFKGLFDCIQKVYYVNGIQGLYKGFNSCLLGIFVYRGLYFGIYDSGKSILMNQKRENNIFLKLLFAQGVVMFSETMSYPLDTIKRQMMMVSGNSGIKHTSSWQCFRKIVQKDGYLALYKGNAANIFRGIGSSMCLVLFDELKKIKQNNNNI